jgi:hypothetical protein
MKELKQGVWIKDKITWSILESGKVVVLEKEKIDLFYLGDV